MGKTTKKTKTTVDRIETQTSGSETTVTVVIPFCETYTPREMLQEAIDSVDTQVGVDTEILVIEDKHEQGPAHARNVGLDRAETRYVAFLDADDRWKQTKLRDQLERMKQTGAGLCVDGETQYSPLEFVGGVMRSEIFSLTSSITVDTAQHSVRFNESIERREDHLYMMEIAMEAGVCFVPETFIDRTHEQGLSNHVSTSPEQIDEFFEIVTSRIPAATQFKRQYYRTEYVYLGRLKHFDHAYQNALRCFGTSLSYGPSVDAVGAFGLTVIAMLRAYLVAPMWGRVARGTHK